MSKKSKKSVEQVMIEAQAITEAGPIDHNTQFDNWAPPAQETLAESLTEDDEQALMALEVQELQAEAVQVDEAPAEAIEEVQEAPAVQDFDEMVKTLDPEKVDETVVKLAEELDERADFERKVSPDNENIHKTLKKVRAAFTASKNAARVLLAANVDPGFLNRSISEGARYNVYALGKLADVINGLTEGQIGNAINLACMRSLFLARANGVPFTSNMAKACASDKLRDVDPSVRKWLIRHTVSASTAPTQASSTMQALETLGLVQRTGTRRDSVYTLTNHPAVEKLERKLGMAKAA